MMVTHAIRGEIMVLLYQSCRSSAGQQVDIVPYNPWLSRKFHTHINLEACTAAKSVKYLFEFVYKAHVCANVEVVQRDDITHDELSQFLEARYVSPPEAFWHISEHPLHGQSHTVKVHNLGDVLSKLQT